ncbi:hypothetical protein IQ13_4264 [Lacibacter cauensis]|uniref:Uncharacterized protein n=1 Tax=Lacibacter cauensis TaxID=510947 RepID=A0A562S9S8_9BACT|nr:hypothetical protein IQ13_4264 [Lacibacter cauensis]
MYRFAKKETPHLNRHRIYCRTWIISIIQKQPATVFIPMSEACYTIAPERLSDDSVFFLSEASSNPTSTHTVNSNNSYMPFLKLYCLGNCFIYCLRLMLGFTSWICNDQHGVLFNRTYTNIHFHRESLFRWSSYPTHYSRTNNRILPSINFHVRVIITTKTNSYSFNNRSIEPSSNFR